MNDGSVKDYTAEYNLAVNIMALVGAALRQESGNQHLSGTAVL